MVLRTVRRLSTWGVLLVFAGSLVLPAISARHLRPDADDSLALSAAAANSPLEVGTDGPPSGDAHCAVCHWLRAISGASIRAAATVPARQRAIATTRSRPSDRLGRSAVPAGPSRAPPSVAV